MVPRNIRNVQRQANVKRAARGVGLVAYDMNVAPPMYSTNLLALAISQLRGRRTLREDVMEQAFRITMGIEKLDVAKELAKGKRRRSRKPVVAKDD